MLDPHSSSLRPLGIASQCHAVIHSSHFKTINTSLHSFEGYSPQNIDFVELQVSRSVFHSVPSWNEGWSSSIACRLNESFSSLSFLSNIPLFFLPSILPASHIYLSHIHSDRFPPFMCECVSRSTVPASNGIGQIILQPLL